MEYTANHFTEPYKGKQKSFTAANILDDLYIVHTIFNHHSTVSAYLRIWLFFAKTFRKQSISHLHFM